MSTTDADDPSAVNGRLRPRRTPVGAPARASVRPARKPNDDKTKKPASKPPDKPDDPNKSLPYLRSLCPYCAGRFGSRNSVSKHIARTHSAGGRGEPIECQFCKHSEAEAADIVRHMVDSHPNQYFACLQCHSRFLTTAELAVHKLQICERQKPLSYRKKPSGQGKSTDIPANNEYASPPDFNGIVISCELKPSSERDTADIEDNITTNLILPPGKNSLVSTSMLEKNAVIVLDDIQWNKRIPPNFTFHNSDADQILSRLGVVHRSPRTSDHTRWYKHIEDTTKFERCFDTSFYSKVASNVQENLKKFLDGSFNRFQLEPEHVIKTRRAKNSVVINTAEGFPILLAHEQYSRNLFDSYMPRAIAPKHKWKWDNIESDRHPINPDQIKRDSHVNNCIITLVSSLDIWTQLCMRRKFEAKFNISSFNEKNTEKQNVIVNELKEILESREIPHREGSSNQAVKYIRKPQAGTSTSEFPGSLGLMRAAPQRSVPPAVLSGEWVRPRCYVCCACGDKAQDSKQLSAHIAAQHPLAQVAHYEVVGEALLGADILKHLYVPPSQPISRSRPLRGVRECTKCKKGTTLEELHQHMLECAGDTPVVRRKGRSRPFGVRRRRTRLPDETLRKKGKIMRSRQARQKTHMRPRPRIRTEVGDAETIRKMIADLPAKRHRVSVTPSNPMLRPRRMREQPRNKLLMKRRATDDPKNKKERGGKDFVAPGGSESADRGAGPSGASRPAKLRSSNITKPRISRIATKVMRQSEVFKRKTLMRNAKRKARAIIEAASKDNFDDAPMGTSSFKTVTSLAADNTPDRIDVNKGGGNPRGHAARDNNGSQDERKSGGASNEQAQNGQNNRPAQNTPLKHSIAQLTAATETHDKSVQFQPHFLVQQECYKNLDRPYRPVEPQRRFENDIAAAKLDKPPLFDLNLGSAEQQKNKSNKPRKGLNDCIAMLKNKLVEPISPGASAGHRSVQCDTADMPQYAAPPLPHLPEYISQSLSPDAPRASPRASPARSSRRSASTSPAVVSPRAPATPCNRPDSVAQQITLSTPNTPTTTAGPSIDPYLIASSLSITPFSTAPASTVTRSLRQKSQASTKPTVAVTRSSARSSATAKSRSQRQSSVSRDNPAAISPPSGRSQSTDNRTTTRKSSVNPEAVAMKAATVQPMGPPHPVMPLATAKSPVSYKPWALSRSPVNVTPPSPVRSPVNYPHSGPAISPVTFTSSPPNDREKSPGNSSQSRRENSPGYYSQMVREKSPCYARSSSSESPVNYLPQATAKSPVRYSLHTSGYMYSDRDKSPSDFHQAALSQPALYMLQGFGQSPATYPPRTPEKLPGNLPLENPAKSPVNYSAQSLAKSPVSYPSQFPAKPPVDYPPQSTAKSPVNLLAKPIKSPLGYNVPVQDNMPTYHSPREPGTKLPINYKEMDHAKSVSELSNYMLLAPAKSPVSSASQSLAKSPVTFTQSIPLNNEHANLISPAPVRPASFSMSLPGKDPQRAPLQPTSPTAKIALTTKLPVISPLAPLNLQPPVAQISVRTSTTHAVGAPIRSPASASSPSAIRAPASMTSPGSAPMSLTSNQRSKDMHTENQYPLLEMNIPPAHARTSDVSMISPLDLSGKSSVANSLVKSTYDEAYETLDLSNKSTNSDNVANAIKDSPIELITKDDIVNLCTKKLVPPEVLETLDLSAKIHNIKENTSQFVEHNEPASEPLKQLPLDKKVQEKRSQSIPPRGSDKSMLTAVYDPTLKISQLKMRPTSSACTTSDEKDGNTLEVASNTASDTKTLPSTKDTLNEDISNTPDTTMVAPTIAKITCSKEAQSTFTSIAAASIAECSSTLSGAMSSQLATSLINSLVSLPRAINTAVTGTTTTTCTTSTSDRRSEIVVPIDSVEDLETAKKIAMLPKEILEILGKMPTDHRNQLLDVLPQYMIYNNAVKQLKLVVDISPDTLTSPITMAKLASSKSEIATQTSSTSTEEVCPPEFLNVDTEKFLIDPFTGAITERAHQESETEKPEQDEIIDMTKDANMDKVEEGQVTPLAEEALNLMAVNKEISETAKTFTIPSDVTTNKQKKGSEKTASLRAVRIKTSERRMSQHNLNNLIGKVVQKLPLVSNSLVPEKEELRTQLEAKTPPAIQQAEVSSTQQNGNKNTAVDSTSPVATKDMNVTTQNKERRTSTGIDEHDSSRNNASVDEITAKECVELPIAEEKILEDVSIDEKTIPIKNDPVTKKSISNKAAPIQPLNEVEEMSPMDKKVSNTTMPTNKSTPRAPETVNLACSDDSDDDISLAVILKQKTLNQRSQPKESQDAKNDNSNRDNSIKTGAQNIPDTLPPSENLENVTNKSRIAIKAFPTECPENKVKLTAEEQTDAQTTETINKVPSGKKRKSRRRIAKQQNSTDIKEQNEEMTTENVSDMKNTAYHDKENADETSNIDSKCIPEKLNSDPMLTKADTRIKHCKVVYDQSEIAKLDTMAVTGSSLQIIDRNKIPDSTEAQENISNTYLIEPNIIKKKSNIGKRSKKRNNVDIVETTTDSGKIDSENNVEAGEKICAINSISLDSPTLPTFAESAKSKITLSETTSFDESIKDEEEIPNPKTTSGRSKRYVAKVNTKVLSYSTQTLISAGPKGKISETASITSIESINVEEDMYKTKSGRSNRSTARGSPKLSSYDSTQTLFSTESKEKCLETPSRRYEECLKMEEEMLKTKLGRTKRSISKDSPKVSSDDMTQTLIPAESKMNLAETPTVRFDESLNVEEDLLKTKPGRSKRLIAKDTAKILSSDDLTLSLSSDDGFKPLRRSRRGKSMYVETPILDTPESLQTDIFMENKAPLTKKQLIFSKLLLDEENNAKLSTNLATPPQIEEQIVVANHVAEPMSTQEDRSDYTPNVTIDATIPTTEPANEKRKLSRRKKSPNSTQEVEKLDNVVNHIEDPVTTKQDHIDFTPKRTIDETIPMKASVFEKRKLSKRKKLPNVTQQVKKADDIINQTEEPVASKKDCNDHTLDVTIDKIIPIMEPVVEKRNLSKCKKVPHSKQLIEEPDNDGNHIEKPVATKEDLSCYALDETTHGAIPMMEPVVPKRKSIKRKKSPNSKQHYKRKRSHENDEYECILMHAELDPKQHKEKSQLETSIDTLETSSSKENDDLTVKKYEVLKEMPVVETSLIDENKEKWNRLSEILQKGDENMSKPEGVVATLTDKLDTIKESKRKSRKSKHSSDKDQNGRLLNDAAIPSPTSTSKDSKECLETTKDQLQLEINIDTAETLTVKDISFDNDEATKQERAEETTTKDETEKLNLFPEYPQTENDKFDKADVDIETDASISAKETNSKSKKSKLCITKRKNHRPLNEIATPSFKSRNNKKNIKTDENELSNIEDFIKDTNVRRNEQTKTTCYDMPRAAARTRAKSLLIKSFMDEIYDPYDIDLEDKLLQNIEPITKKVSALQDKPEHDMKVISKVENKTKKKMRTKTTSESLTTVTSTLLDTASNVKDNSSDSDSSKSDVPLKKYAEENAKTHKKVVQQAASPGREGPSPRKKPVTKRKTPIIGGKRKRPVENIIEDTEQSPEKQLEDAEELRSEQFMESFGFFSERKPRKSNLLASKKISETFHIIANEKDDQYFSNKDKAAKRGDRKKSTSVSHTYDQACTARGIGHARRARRSRKKRIPNPLTFCEICRKEFQRQDNFTRHKMALVHITHISPNEDTDAEPNSAVPNYLVIYKQHLDKLRRLTEKLQKKHQKLGLDTSEIKVPSVKEVMADAKIHQYRLQKYRNRRGLSREEALFLHCCELLKSNHYEVARATYSEEATSRPVASSSMCVMATTGIVTGESSTSKSNDSDVDSITAKAIMESEEVRNLENDLISGIKEAVELNLAASAAKADNMNGRKYEYDTGLDGHTSDLDAHNLDSVIPGLDSRLAHRRATSSGDELTDKLSSPKTGNSPFSPGEELDSAEEPVRVRKPRRSAAKLSEMLDIDLFEDKFDKIKRKCRSQAAAAKNTHPVTESTPSTSGASYKVNKKGDKSKIKKSSSKNLNMVMTKGALKGFEGFKVSIPTSDIDMSAIVPGLGESPPCKKNKGNGKKRREQPESSVKYDREQPGPADRPGSSDQPGSSNQHDQLGPSGASGAQGNLDVYEFLDNDEAELFPASLKERYRTLKYGPSVSRADSTYRQDDDSASGSDGDDFVYMSDDYMCSPDETENSVMSCELPSTSKIIPEPKKSALKRKDAVEKNAVMGKIFKNNAVRTDKKSDKGKEPAKSPKANLDQLFDSLLETEPPGGGGSARCVPRPAAPRDRARARTTPVPSSESEHEPFGDDSPLRVDSPVSPDLPDSPGTPPSPEMRTTPDRKRRSSPEYTRRWASSTVPSPRSTLQYPQPGTSRDSLPYDVSEQPEMRKTTLEMTRVSHDDAQHWAPRSMRPPRSTLDEPQPGCSRDSLPFDVSDQPDSRSSPVRKRRVMSEYARRWTSGGMLSPRSTLEDPQPGTSRDSLPYELSDNDDDGGVARHRARRKCTVGKQNVLAESWSSESEQDGGKARANSTESVLTPVGRKKKGKKGTSSQQGQKRVRHVTFKKQEKAPSPEPVSKGGKELKDAKEDGKEGKEGGGRAPAAAAYTWSPEGEAEAPAHAPQHGWIVGNSHKKLVTMLAHAKGRRRDDRRNLDE